MDNNVSALNGTTAESFQVGQSGPILKNADVAQLEVRNADDTDFAVVSAAPPVGPNDLVTKSYIASGFPTIGLSVAMTMGYLQG